MNSIKLSPDATDPQPVAAPDVAQQIATDATAALAAAAPVVSLAGPYGAAALVAAQAVLAAYKALLPSIEDMVNKGLVSVDVQNSVNAQFQDIAVTHATAFKGPEWTQD